MTRKNRFSGKVRQALENEAKPVVFGYVNMPDGWEYFDPMKARTKDCTADNEEPWLIELDIMPYTVTSENHMEKDVKNGIAIAGDAWFRSRFLGHRNVNNHRDLCLKTIGLPCPICDYRKELLDSGRSWDEQEVKDLRPQNRDLYIVIPKNSNDYEDKPYLWDVSTFTFSEEIKKKLNILEKKKRTQGKYEGFADLEEGFTLEVAFIVNKFNGNEFAKISGIDFIDREEQYTWDKLDEMPKLDDLFRFKTYKELQSEFYNSNTDGEEEEEKEDEEVVSEPTTKRKQKTIVTTSKCPHGHEFGDDFDKKSECRSCDVYDDCLDVA